MLIGRRAKTVCGLASLLGLLGCSDAAKVDDDSQKDKVLSGESSNDACKYVCTWNEDDCRSGMDGTPVPGKCDGDQVCCYTGDDVVGTDGSSAIGNGNNLNGESAIGNANSSNNDGTNSNNDSSSSSSNSNTSTSDSSSSNNSSASDSSSSSSNNSSTSSDGSTGSGATSGDGNTDDRNYTEEAVTDIEVEVEAVSERVHYDNPFANATKWYINEWWSENAKASGGEAIADVSTGVWMDRIAAIESYGGQSPNENFGLRDHLDACLAQGADLFYFVVYDLPGRDCAAEASNGELPASAAGMAEYKNEYIGRIFNILADEAYAKITVVAIIEIDSLPNLVTNSDKAACQAVDNSSPYGYTEGIRFALSQLKKLPNVHSYVDAAHSGWLGWDEKFDESTAFLADVIAGSSHAGVTSAPGWDSINGFITNTSNYTPLEEPYFGDPEAAGNDGMPLRSASFYDWNPVFGELQFSKKWREAMIRHGAGEDLGMLIDTSRNGWGGAERPTEASSATNPEDVVDESRIDRRPHRGSWCNQQGGIGERPQANPPGQDHIDAYVWVKPPGESDGISTPDFEVDPNDKNKKYDPMCGPNDVNHYAEEADSTRGKGVPTGAMEGAPHAGRWYEEGFRVLLENAYPPL